ncbi:MAG: sulfite exporter TauE/SafE family protein [Salinisphaeraceae bacterium]|nr:sulfite exporter TauE/SafE family protein [Salinisphaeraceae bacterium]
MLTFLLTLAAFAAAVLSGITGLGGGTVLIAVIYAVGLLPVVAVPLHAGVQLASNGSRTVAYLEHVDWPSFRWFLLGCVPAPFMVAPLVLHADPNIIRLVMAAFILLAMWPQVISGIRLHGHTGMVVSGVLAGGVGMIVGATGMLVAPIFLREHWEKQRVIATLAVCQTAAHILKIVAFASYGFNVLEYWYWLLPMVIAVIVGTWWGKHLHGKLDEAQFRGLFRVVLLVLVAKLAWDGSVGLGWIAL